MLDAYAPALFDAPAIFFTSEPDIVLFILLNVPDVLLAPFIEQFDAILVFIFPDEFIIDEPAL